MNFCESPSALQSLRAELSLLSQLHWWLVGLAHALPPILEPLAWLIGRWETETFSGLRFPMPMDSGYREIVDINVAEAPMFDRPALNLRWVPQFTPASRVSPSKTFVALLILHSAEHPR